MNWLPRSAFWPIIFVFSGSVLTLAVVLIFIGWILDQKKISWRLFLQGPKKTPANGLSLVCLHLAPKSSFNETDLLKLIYSLEAARPIQSHPITQSILKVAKANNIPRCHVEFFKEVPEMGLAGMIENRPLVYGTRPFMKSCSVEAPPELELQAGREETAGRKVLFVGWEGFVRALAVFSNGTDGAPDSLKSLWPLRQTLRDMVIGAGVALLLAIFGFFFTGCSKAKMPGAAATLSGRILLADAALEPLAGQPNAVCYLIVKDKWGLPVAIKRWLNPQLPLAFELRSSDLLLPSRSWKGPFDLEAYLFASTNPRQELPPPPNAAKARTLQPVSPGNSMLVELALATSR